MVYFTVYFVSRQVTLRSPSRPPPPRVSGLVWMGAHTKAP